VKYTLIVLCGGEGSRMSGNDKGLLRLHGQTFVRTLTQGLGGLSNEPWRPRSIISANRNLSAYESLGYPVVKDIRPGFNGPLAGLEAGLANIVNTDNIRYKSSNSQLPQWDLLPVVVVPCDMPRLPADLPRRLLAALDRVQTIAVAQTRKPDGMDIHPLCLAFHARVWQHDLKTFLDQGQRRVQGWLADKPLVCVEFDDTEAFINVNQPETYTAISCAPGRAPETAKYPAGIAQRQY
jgi:molybdenum cofactor guanylyltransferase